jgi:hypothetical protein
MKFTYHDLGYRVGGEIVVVTVSDRSAHVRLMDTVNFQSYQVGKKHKYYGGHIDSTSCRLQIPHPGHWHIAVDLGGEMGYIRSSVRVFPRALSPLNEAPLLSVPSLFRVVDASVGPDGVSIPKFDVFIFYASEDREDIGIPLVNALFKGRLRASSDAFGIKIGDNLRRRIDMGLAGSRLAVVVLSQAFLKKGWTNDELDGLVTKASTGEQIIMPLWHKVSRQDVINFSPSLANKLARSTSVHTVEEIAAEIVEAIKFSKIQEARILSNNPKTDQPTSKERPR